MIRFCRPIDGRHNENECLPGGVIQAHRMDFFQNVSEAAPPTRSHSPRGRPGARSRVVMQGNVVYPDLVVFYA
jgi:hypothetical protein